MITVNVVNMGHDITARIADTNEFIASLRISGERCRRNTKIYEVLGVQHFNALDSGTGDRRIFDCKTLSRVQDSKKLTTPEELFIKQCLAYCSKEGIEIHFA